ncbi:hypothetical protein GCM10023091_08160 [Ravibacter arvi]|uniref:DUF1232 domain-containing protein n=1 Tax=Ravibacter arvi TaxID=2051041 RepID=A0ABP8LSX0_9BACT
MKAGDSLIQRILKSAIFAKMMRSGMRLTKNKALLLVMLQQGVQKMENKGVAEGVRDVKEQLLLMIRFVRAYATGAYRDVAIKSMATIVGVLVYFISPLDLIPDVLPILGIADDVALVVWMFNVLEKEIAKFSDWEKRNTIKIG